MSQKILIFGAGGYFGQHFTKFFQKQGWEVITERVDIRDFNAVENSLQKFSPDVVLNAAGKTGRPNVDWCENHREETMLVNVSGAINVATACSLQNIYCVHVGSGCVYSGDNEGNGFSEEDSPNFDGSFYSKTKILSEKALKEFNVLQLRVRIPIEGKSCSKNVIDKLLKYEKLISMENSFTVVEDFLPATYELIKRKETGVFNMTNCGSMDHEYLMTQYQQIVDPEFKFQLMDLEELKKYAVAPRSNTVLTCEKREKLGINMPDIKERVKEILAAYMGK